MALGLAQFNRGQWDLAHKAFQRALEIHPKLYKAYQGLGHIAKHYDKDSEFLQDMNEAISIAEDRTPKLADNDLASLYADRVLAAILQADKVRKASPKDPKANAEAREHYSKSLEDLARIRQILGQVTRTDFTLTYRSALAEEGLGLVETSFGSPQEAEGHFRKARQLAEQSLSLYPSSTYVKDLLKRLDGRLKDRP